MHRITLDIQDNGLVQLMNFISKMPQNDITLIEDKVIIEQKNNPFDFSDLKITAFRGIDPVAWQKESRDEWE